MNLFTEISQLKPNGEEVFKTMDKLTIYNSQYNIAQEIYYRWLVKDPGANRLFTRMNLLFVGPTYTNLREQTRDDVLTLAKHIKLFGNQCNDAMIRTNVDSIVLNSNKLKSIEDIQFLKDLEADTNGQLIHVLIHDEAHWGIKEDSIILNFFDRVLTLMESSVERSRPKLLILLVSATSDVIFRAVPSICHDNTRVKWNALMSSEHLSFKSSTYRGVSDLNYFNDIQTSHCKIPLKDLKSLADRSTCVCDQFISAANNCAAFFRRLCSTPYGQYQFGIGDDFEQIMRRQIGTPADYALTQLLLHQPGNVNHLSSLNAYTPLSSRNKIVVIRLPLVADANRLASGLRQAFSVQGFSVPFEIINLSGSETVFDLLSPHGKSFLGADKDIAVEQLNDIPVVLIVVDKLKMGERLPASCVWYDVRAVYAGSYNNMKNGSKAQFVQDVGRCAGHKKNDVIVAVSLQTDDNVNVFNSPPKNNKDHDLMKANSTELMPGHTEHSGNNQIYSRMSNYCILLDAEPQIGKTGAFLSLINIIHANHVENSPNPSFGAPSTTNLENDREDRKFGSFRERSSYLRRLNQSQGFAGLKAVMQGEYFRQYHKLLHESRGDSNTNDIIVCTFVKDLMRISKESCNELCNWKIADCGCGLHGVVQSFNKYIATKSFAGLISSVTIYGIDTDDSINTCATELHKNVTFIPIVDDYNICLPELGTKLDMIILNCSLWGKENGAVLKLVHENLQVGGYLILVDLDRRLPNNWERLMQQIGWSVPEEFELQTSVRQVDFYKASVWQKTNERFNESIPFTFKDED